jgi:hypothetical protein
MKRLEIELTAGQARQLRPIEQVLEQRRGTGCSTIGQVMFYEDRTVLFIGVLPGALAARIRAITMAADDDTRLLDLPLDAAEQERGSK